MSQLVMVLPDGETYMDLEGSSIVQFADDLTVEEFEDGLREMGREGSVESADGRIKVLTVFAAPA